MVNKIGIVAILLMVLAAGYGIGISVDDIKSGANSMSQTVSDVTNVVEDK